MRFSKTIVAGILLALVFGNVSTAVNSPETLRKIERRRRLQRIGAYERAKGLLDARKLQYADVLTTGAKGTAPGSMMDDWPRAASRFSTLDLDTLDSPGLALGITSYDQQHNNSSGHQVARDPGASCVHFTWTYCGIIPGDIEHCDREVVYKTFELFNPCISFPGCPTTSVSLGDFARAGYPRLDVGSGNRTRLAFHQRPSPDAEYESWHLDFLSECSDLNSPAALGNGGLGSLIFPDVAVTQSASGDVRHVIAHDGNDYPRDLLVYWRYDESTGGPWAGPAILDSTDILGYAVDAADNSGKVAVVYHSTWAHDGLNEMRNVVYRESQTGGLGWIDGAELGEGAKTMISTYGDPLGPEAWVHISVAYDHSGNLNVIWDEQRWAGRTEDIALKHWGSGRGTIRTIALGYYENPGIQSWNLNLAKPTLGVGDGTAGCADGAETNLDYQYVVYTKMCGETPEEAEDMSKRGYCSGELYVTGSRDGGNTWSPPQNLTNTKTPGCTPDHPDSVCASEHWATIARDVDDHLDIFYILDFDAGSVIQAEGGWTINRAMYLRLPEDGLKSVDPDYVCPLQSPNYFGFLTSDPECEYHADVGGINSEQLTIMNLGNADLSGTIMVTQGAAWLSVSGSPGYFIAAAGPDEGRTVTMGPVAVEGVNIGHIEVIHNDTSKPSTVDFEIEFFVVNGFNCPERALLKTAVTSSR